MVSLLTGKIATFTLLLCSFQSLHISYHLVLQKTFDKYEKLALLFENFGDNNISFMK